MDNKKYIDYEDDFRTVSLDDVFDIPEFDKGDKLYALEEDVEETEVTDVPVIFNVQSVPRPLKQMMEFGDVANPEINDDEVEQTTPLEVDNNLESASAKQDISFGEVVGKQELEKEEKQEEQSLLESVGVFKTDEQQEELYEESSFQGFDSEINTEEIEPTKQYSTIDEKQIMGGILEKVDEVDKKQQEQFVQETYEENKPIEKDIKEKSAKVEKERLGFNWFFWFSFIIILVPIGFFGWILYSASQETHVPIIGSRLNNSINKSINETQIDNIQNIIKKIDGVQKVSVTLNVATLRVTIDVQDDLTEEKIIEISKAVYSAIDEKLPIETYFTTQGSYKQYDLEINLYNNLDAESLIIVTLTKNGKMEDYEIQVVTNPRNKDVADRLRGNE